VRGRYPRQGVFIARRTYQLCSAGAGYYRRQSSAAARAACKIHDILTNAWSFVGARRLTRSKSLPDKFARTFASGEAARASGSEPFGSLFCRGTSPSKGASQDVPTCVPGLVAAL
jgi:hypothetical protein